MRSLIEYIRSSRAELEKVSWPSRQDTLRYGGLVMAASILAALFFAALDFGLQRSIRSLLIVRSRTSAPAGRPAAAAPAEAPNIQLEPTAAEGINANGQPADIKVETLPLPQ